MTMGASTIPDRTRAMARAACNRLPGRRLVRERGAADPWEAASAAAQQVASDPLERAPRVEQAPRVERALAAAGNSTEPNGWFEWRVSVGRYVWPRLTASALSSCSIEYSNPNSPA